MVQAIANSRKHDYKSPCICNVTLEGTYESPTISNIATEEFVIPAMLAAAAVSGADGGAVGAVVSKLMS